MVKHFAFWVGFFAASLLIVPVAIGIWGAAEEYARNIAVFLFGAISVLVALLVLLLFFRDRILRRVLGSAETTLDDVTSSLIKGVSAAARGDVFIAEQEAQAFAKSATGWYVWSGFYRWVVGSAIGLLLAFGAFAGTVLLFEQTRKLGEQTVLMSQQSELMQAQTDRMAEQATQVEMQNEIMTISLVAELRNQLASTVERLTVTELFAQDRTIPPVGPVFTSQDGQCGLEVDLEAQFAIPPSDAMIDAIVDLGVNRQISSQVRRALRFLLKDRDSAVAFGALQALERSAGLVIGDLSDVEFNGIFVQDAAFRGDLGLSFVGSLISSIDCPDCDLRFDDSYLVGVNAAEFNAYDSVYYSDDLEAAASSNILYSTIDDPLPDFAFELNTSEDFVDSEEERAVMIHAYSTNICETLSRFGDDNAFLAYVDIVSP